jgi:uroporphyrinogen-III synthase
MNTQNEVEIPAESSIKLFHLINFDTSIDLDEIHKTVTSVGQQTSETIQELESRKKIFE